jgi:hypothetical protein
MSTQNGLRRLALRLRNIGLWRLLVAPTLVLIVSGLILAWLLDPPKPGSGGSPRDVIDQIQNREFWISPIQKMPSAEISWSLTRPIASIHNGQPVVVTPAELAEDGAAYEGEDVIVVGRVAENISLQVPNFSNGTEGIGDEIRLDGSENTAVYLGINGKHPIRQSLVGDLVFAFGRVAAMGRARLPIGKSVRAAYFLVTGGGRGKSFAQFVTSNENIKGLAQAIQVALVRARGGRPSSIPTCSIS